MQTGFFCPESCVPLPFRAEEGSVCGVGNGNPACHESDVLDHITTFNGLALLCIVNKRKSDGYYFTHLLPGLISDGECKV